MKEETKKTLAQVSTATLTLQLLKRGIRNTYMRGVAPLGPMAERLVGEAVTLRFIPMREDLSTLAILADHNNPQRVAIDTIPAGAILVIDARGVADCASLGDILAERIKQRGGAGVVTDGGVRDATAMALWLFQKILWTKSRGSPSIKKTSRPLSSGRSKMGTPQ